MSPIDVEEHLGTGNKKEEANRKGNNNSRGINNGRAEEEKMESSNIHEKMPPTFFTGQTESRYLEEATDKGTRCDIL